MLRKIMTTTINTHVSEFFKTAIYTQDATVNYFKEKEHELSFDDENSTVWQFIILKSFDVEFSHLLPLANYLIDNKYCIVDLNMAKYAALNGFSLETELNRMQKPLDEVNKFTKDCGFSEKLIISNKPAENILSLAKKIINHSTDDDFNNVKEIFNNLSIDISNSKILNKPNTKKTLNKP